MKFFFASTALALLGLSGLSSAGYTLEDSFVASNFFSQFNFMTEDDPTNGYVNYIDQTTAQSSGLINTNNNKIYIGVDSTTVNPSGRGRNSVRIESKKQYTHGLFLLDLNHMPSSTCGVWPAFWTYGPNWPDSGEIDILEGVNTQSADSVSLHTSGTCKATSGSGFSGSLTSNDCAVSTGGGTGCSIHSSDSATYGTGLNNANGGVYAMEWLSTGIKVWFFARGAIPSDITSGSPNPSGWSTPIAYVPSTSCNIDSNFANHWVVFDTTFCGDWAGADFTTNAACKNLASSCQAYVAANPTAFSQVYWDINSLKIYQSSGTASAQTVGSSSVAAASPVASVISSASETESESESTSTSTSTSSIGHKGGSSSSAATTTGSEVVESSASTNYATATATATASAAAASATGKETSTSTHANQSSATTAAATASNGSNGWNNSNDNGGQHHGGNNNNNHGRHSRRQAHVHAHAHVHGRRGRRVERSF